MLKTNSSRKKATLPRQYHVKKGDTVMVISGKDKGKTGTIKRVLRDRGKVIVEGLNMMKKAVRPNPMLGMSGGLVEMEAPLNVSKVMLYDLKNNKPSRVKREIIEGRNIRVFKKTGEHLDA